MPKPHGWMTWEEFKREVERQMRAQGLDPATAVVSSIEAQGWNSEDLRVTRLVYDQNHFEVQS